MLARSGFAAGSVLDRRGYAGGTLQKRKLAK
jgi:hypothetical protein